MRSPAAVVVAVPELAEVPLPVEPALTSRGLVESPAYSEIRTSGSSTEAEKVTVTTLARAAAALMFAA